MTHQRLIFLKLLYYTLILLKAYNYTYGCTYAYDKFSSFFPLNCNSYALCLLWHLLYRSTEGSQSKKMMDQHELGPIRSTLWKPQGSDKVFKKCYVAKEELEAILVRNMILGVEREIHKK